MTKSALSLAGYKVGVFGKGGAGKSTITVLLTYALSQRGYGVNILDADSTNVGLHQALGIDHLPASLLDYYGGAVFRGGAVTCPVDDPTPLPNPVIRWDTLPRDYWEQRNSNVRYLFAGKIGGQGPGAGCDGPIAKIARDLIIQDDLDRSMTLVDFKAGFEDSARGVIGGLDWAIVVVDPTTAAVQMAIDMQRMVDQIKAGVLPATAHLETPELVAAAHSVFRNAPIKGVQIILNRVASAGAEDIVRRRLESQGLTPLGTIRDDPDIASAWLTGSQVRSQKAEAEMQRVVDKFEQVVIQEDDFQER